MSRPWCIQCPLPMRPNMSLVRAFMVPVAGGGAAAREQTRSLPVLLGYQGTPVLRGEPQQPLFAQLCVPICLGDLEQIGVEGGVMGPGVEPATGEAVTVASAGSPDEDIDHARMVTSLGGTCKHADQTRDCGRERGTARRDHARGSGPTRGRPGTAVPVVCHATAVAGLEGRE